VELNTKSKPQKKQSPVVLQMKQAKSTKLLAAKVLHQKQTKIHHTQLQAKKILSPVKSPKIKKKKEHL
jgi:hypothetical protein